MLSESKKVTTSINSKNHTINEMDQHILRQLQRAEVKRVALRGKAATASHSLTEEFFEGLKIV